MHLRGITRRALIRFERLKEGTKIVSEGGQYVSKDNTPHFVNAGEKIPKSWTLVVQGKAERENI